MLPPIIEIFKRHCDTCECKVVRYGQHCKRCQYDWQSPKESPKSCPRCQSKNWMDEMTATRYPEIHALEIGATIQIPWPDNPLNRARAVHPAARIVRKLYPEKKFTVTYSQHGATITRIA